MKKFAVVVGVVLCLCVVAHADEVVTYSGDGGDLQQVIDAAPAGATVVCETAEPVTLTKPVIITKALTLKGLDAQLPEALGRTQLLIVRAEGVTLIGLKLKGNYDSVDQKQRAPMVRIARGNFRVEDCTFADGSKDGVNVAPEKQHPEDIVGGAIKNITAFRMGRDAVSISGGNRGLKVRDVTVENVSLKKGYLRGAVEVSDGTDNITVRHVYAEDCRYGIDVQDHRGESGSNTNITIEDVTARNCGNILRTGNSPRGHANLTLRNFTGDDCEAPLLISNTDGVTVEGLKITNHHSKTFPPMALKNCQNVTIKNATIETKHYADEPIAQQKCEGVKVTGLTVTKRE